MQLGDTHAMLGRMDESIACHGKGLEIQMACPAWLAAAYLQLQLQELLSRVL